MHYPESQKASISLIRKFSIFLARSGQVHDNSEQAAVNLQNSTIAADGNSQFTFVLIW
jgi:hypothetical protein